MTFRNVGISLHTLSLKYVELQNDTDSIPVYLYEPHSKIKIRNLKKKSQTLCQDLWFTSERMNTGEIEST